MKGKISSCLLFVLSFALFLTSFSFVFSDKASAASVFDNVNQPIDKLEFDFNGQKCDLTYNWYTKMKQSYNGSKNLDNFLTDDYYWGVFKWEQSGNRQIGLYSIKKEYAFGYTTYGYKNATTNAQPSFGVPFNSFDMFKAENYPTSYIYVVGDVNSACNMQNTGDFGSPFTDKFQSDVSPGDNEWAIVPFATNARIFFAAPGFVPPSNYSGGRPSEEAPKDITDIVVRPSGVYTVNDRRFVMQNAYTLRQSIEMVYPSYPKAFQVPEGYFSYIITKCEDDFVNCQTIKSESNVSSTSKIEFEFDDYGFYSFTYGYTFPSVVPKPASPQGTVLKYDVQSFQLLIDGSSYTGTSSDRNCSNGFCPSPSPYEDCGSYGTDIIGGIGCQFRNFGVLLKSVFMNLFVPDSKFLKSYQTAITDFFNQKLGFLATSIGFITGLFTSIINGAANTSCTITPTGTFFGSSFTIDVCTFQRITSGGFAAIQTLIIGLTSIALFFAGLRKYHEVVDRR